MMHSVRFLLGAVSAVAILTSAAGAYAQALPEVVKLAVETNPQIGVVSANRQAVAEELRQARGLYLPQVDLTGSVGPQWSNDIISRSANLGTNEEQLTSEGRLAVTQRLFTGFQTTNEVERQKSRVSSAASRVYDNAENIALDAIGAYLEVIRQRELYALSKQNVNFHQEILSKLEQRLTGGVGTRADVAQTRAREARGQATLAQTANDLGDAEAFYTRVTGQFPGELTRPDFPVAALPQSIDAAVQLAQHNNPKVRTAEYDVDVTESEREIANAPFYPQFNLVADTGYNDDQSARDTYGYDSRVLVRGSVNLFRGGIDRAARQEAVQRMHQAREDRSRIANEQKEEARRSWFAYQASAQRVQQLESAVKDLKDTRDAYEQQFNIGQRSLLDLLDAENELFTARGQLLSADLNQLRSGYRMLAADGQLLKTLQIAAPKQSDVKSESFDDSIWGRGAAEIKDTK
ncbi:MAG TPA: TolC family outer membrane protein [Methylophilus sp.]